MHLESSCFKASWQVSFRWEWWWVDRCLQRSKRPRKLWKKKRYSQSNHK